MNQPLAGCTVALAEGRQLARSGGKPTLLFLARTHLGAGRESAQIALRECFAAPEFAALSGVVMADSWKLYVTSWHPGPRPDVPFAEAERARASRHAPADRSTRSLGQEGLPRLQKA